MNRRLVVLSLVACLVVGLTLPATVQAADPLARTQLTKTVAMAKQWVPDAVLTSISSIMVNKDGSGKQWLHSFYSPKTKRYMIITVKANSIDTSEVRTGFAGPIGEDFIDSDKAMAIAKKSGLKGSSYSMGLNMMGAAGMNSSPVWSVNGGFDKGDVSVMLDAKTGKVLRTEVMKGFD